MLHKSQLNLLHSSGRYAGAFDYTSSYLPPSPKTASWLLDGQSCADQRGALIFKSFDDCLNVAFHGALVQLLREVAHNAILGDAVVINWRFDTHTRLLIGKSRAQAHSDTKDASIEMCHWPAEVGDLPDEWVVVHELQVKCDHVFDLVVFDKLFELALEVCCDTELALLCNHAFFGPFVCFGIDNVFDEG